MRRVIVSVLLAAAAGGAWLLWRPAGEPPAVRTFGARDIARQAGGNARRGEHDAAAAAYRRASEAALAEGDADLARGYLAQSAVSLKLGGRTAEARTLMEQALADARTAHDRHTEGLALGNLARIEFLEGRIAEALRYLDGLADLAHQETDPALEVKTLEQCAVGAMEIDQPQRAIDAIERALPIDDALPVESRRHDALLSQKANALAALGDDEGAYDLWQDLPQSPAVQANRARHLSQLGQHVQAADLALAAAQGFGAEGAGRQDERDRALEMHLSELIEARQLDPCAERLAQVLKGEGDEIAQAPFRVQRARLMLAQDRPADAVDDLARAAAALAGTAPAGDVSLLLALALAGAGRASDARGVLEALPASLGREFLLARLLVADPPGDALLAESLPRLSPSRYDAADASLDHLRELSPRPLPSLAFVAFEAGLADSRRLREHDEGLLADGVFRNGAAQALRWQAIEASRRLFGRRPGAGELAAQAATVAGWVGAAEDRRLPPDAAVLAVLPGESSSHLVVCTRALGVTSFGLPSAGQLAARASAVVAALHGSSTDEVARLAFELWTALIPAGARADLRDARRWTLILPDELASVPPAMLVTQRPVAGAAPAWLVRDHDVLLLPHAVGAGPSPSVTADRWLSVRSPALDRARLPLVAAAWLAFWGESVFESEAVGEPPAGAAISEKGATAGLLRRMLPGAGGLLLSVPAAGGGRLGGLLLAPDADAPRGDERAGFLPWHRIPELPLPPDVILDDSRFLPGPDGQGPTDAATAFLVRGRHVLLTRWPLAPALRGAVLAEVQARREQGASPGAALASVQREMLRRAEQAGDAAAEHPRVWAAWLPYGLD